MSVADIKYANGADNALMNILEQKNLLFRLKAYSGWNTATNSTGFALGTGMLARKMTNAAKNHLLTVRYLDDWAYQANVRAQVGTEFRQLQVLLQSGGQACFCGKMQHRAYAELCQKAYAQYFCRFYR